MEQKNRVPQDPKRRWVLATLLSIPPALFGLEPLDYISNVEKTQHILGTIQHKSVDISEQSNGLENCWKLYYSSSTLPSIQEILHRIRTLRENIFYVHAQQKATMMQLLCDYHVVLACILSDQQQFDQAIDLLNVAIPIAKENDLSTSHALALYQHGIILFDRWEMSREQRNQTDLFHAISDFDLAYKIGHSVDSQLRGAILLLAGEARANATQTEKDKTDALTMMDKGWQIAQHNTSDDKHFVKLNEERYHNNKGSALTAMGRPKAGIDELCSIDGFDSPELLRRHAYNHVLQAKAYTRWGYYPMATTIARDVLTSIRNIESNINLARITNIYHNLKESSYGSSIDVAQLGVELMKTRQPQVFQ